jgi:hypothetical protein
MSLRRIGIIAVALGLAAVSACTDDPNPPKDPSESRCRFAIPAGGCYTTPTDCGPVSVPAGPPCPSGAELIQVSEDHCGDFRGICPL